MGRKTTRFPGVYERPTDSQLFKGKPDIAYTITYWSGKGSERKKVWERVGLLSEGYSPKLASDIRAERIRAMRHGEELPHEKKAAPTFAALAEKYIKWSSDRPGRSGINDKGRYENHLKPRLGDKRLDAISSFDLERLKGELFKCGLAPRTIAHCLGLIRAMYNRATAWGMYEGANPVKRVKMPVIQNMRDRFLSVEEADLLLRELKRNPRRPAEDLADQKLHNITLISLHTGARAGEIFNLKGQDIDLDHDLITLRDTKNKETRYAPMTAAVKEILERRRPADPSVFVFTDRRGQKIKEVSNAFERVVKRLGFNEGVTDTRQKIVFHSCRHTFASWLAIQGTPLYTIAQLMGHKSISMSERYAHLSPDHKKDAINGLEAALKKQRQPVKIEKGGGGK